MPSRDGLRGDDRAEDARRTAVRAPGLPLVVLLCAAAVALIWLLDAARAARSWSTLAIAVLDEPAHLATAALLLAAVLPWRERALAGWALAGAVLIDLDHVPLYLWGALTIDGHGRPVPHSLATVLVLAAAGWAARGRVRTALLGLALGVGLHLVRDLATGPGVPLWWPLATQTVLLPYAVYLTAMGAVAVVVVGRAVLAHRRRRAGAALGS
jgi:inner membrane protein